MIKQYVGNVTGSSNGAIQDFLDACYPSGMEILTTPMAGSWTDKSKYVFMTNTSVAIDERLGSGCSRKIDEDVRAEHKVTTT
jgi:hypothetical protein